jgi:hypothetical protein
LDKPNGINHKVKLKNGQETSNSVPSASEKQDRPSDSSPRKADSTPSAFGGRESGAMNSGGGWQTTKKKHKRNAKSTVDPRHLNGAEPLPADESMRKGG